MPHNRRLLSRFGARLARFGRFGLVGLSGLAVNSLAMLVFVDGLGVQYLLSAALATQVSTTWNYVGVEHWAFRDSAGRRLRRFGAFAMLNNTAFVVRLPAIWLLTDGLGLHPGFSNVLSLVTLTFVRFSVADTLIWRRGGVVPTPDAAQLSEA